MKINAEKLRRAEIKIIERIQHVSKEAPINLDSLEDLEVDDLDYGNYLIYPEEEETFYDISVTTFSVYENKECVLFDGNLEDLQDYLKSKKELFDEDENKGENNCSMKINTEKLEKAKVCIIEEIHNVQLERPVDLKSLDELDINDLNYGDYNIFVEEEHLYDDNSETLFSVYENDKNVLESGNLSDLRNYLKSGGFCGQLPTT